MDKFTTSITFYGKPIGRWLDVYNDAKTIFEILDHDFNYVATSSMDQMRTVKRTEKRVIKELDDETLEDLTMESLPNNFVQACFHYDVMICRDRRFLIITVNKGDYSKLDEEEIIRTFIKYVEKPIIEIFELDRAESPFMYASKINKVESYPELYPSLKVLRTIE